MEEMEGKIRELLSEILERQDTEEIDVSDDLQEFGLDSLNSIELIVKLEEAFQIEISDEYLDMQYVSSIEQISELIEQGDVENAEIKYERE